MDGVDTKKKQTCLHSFFFFFFFQSTGYQENKFRCFFMVVMYVRQFSAFVRRFYDNTYAVCYLNMHKGDGERTDA